MKKLKLIQRNEFLMFLLGRSYGMSELFIETLNELNEPNLRFIHFQKLSHYKAIELMKIADALVCFNPDSDIVTLPSKVFEYMQTHKPIIYVSKQKSQIDSGAEYLKKMKYGLCCNYNKEEIKEQLINLIEWANENHKRKTTEFENLFKVIENNWWGDYIVRK